MIYQQTLLDLSNKKEAHFAMELIALSLVPAGPPITLVRGIKKEIPKRKKERN